MRPIFLALALIAAVSATQPAAAMDARASYVLTLGGLNIATAEVTLADDGTRYAVDLDADVVGLGQLVSGGTAKISSSGRSQTDGLEADDFRLETATGGERFSVRVEYSGGNATEFIVDPPIVDNYNRVPIERSHLRGVSDMVSAFLIKGGSLDQGLCSREAKVFTGLERFDIEMSFAGEDVATSQRTGYQGPVILCSIRYVPISGHFTTSEITTYLAGSDRILIWYAPLRDTGYFIPYRVLMSTSMGDLSMVLTGVSGE